MQLQDNYHIFPHITCLVKHFFAYKTALNAKYIRVGVKKTSITKVFHIMYHMLMI